MGNSDIPIKGGVGLGTWGYLVEPYYEHDFGGYLWRIKGCGHCLKDEDQIGDRDQSNYATKWRSMKEYDERKWCWNPLLEAEMVPFLP